MFEEVASVFFGTGVVDLLKVVLVLVVNLQAMLANQQAVVANQQEEAAKLEMTSCFVERFWCSSVVVVGEV